MNREMESSVKWPDLLKTAVLGRRPKRTLLRVVVLSVTCFVVFRYVLLPVRVTGESMWPTYHDKRVNFVNRLSYCLRPPRHGDVVCIQFGAGRHVMLMKRIVALPGETVAFRRGRLFVNGQPVDEPYVKTPCNWNEPEQRLKPDEYYVVGDNRGMMAADHVHGIAERWRIVGKVLL